MSTRPLVIGDRMYIERALGTDGAKPSEYCFANLFLFAGRHDYLLHDGTLPYISGVTYDGEIHVLPLLPLTPDVAVALFDTGASCLYPFGAEAPKLAERLGLACDYLDADSDYVFDASAMADLRDAKNRRAQARDFETRQRPHFIPWAGVLADEAQEVLAGWLSDVGRSPDETDLKECQMAITHAQDLGLEGGLVRTGAGEAVAFLLASSRADGTKVVHFAKGRRVHSNAYPWMFSKFASASGAKSLNFEQDLGNVGLAQSKRAYAPMARRPKYRLRRY